MSIECTTSANSTVTCLYSADRLACVTGAPHSLQNLSPAAALCHTTRTTIPLLSLHRDRPRAAHVSIVSPLVRRCPSYRRAISEASRPPRHEDTTGTADSAVLAGS